MDDKQKPSAEDTSTVDTKTDQDQPTNTKSKAPKPKKTIASRFASLPKKKRLLIVIAAIFLLLGGSAAAYFGYIVPNRPENVLKSAVHNSLEQDEVAFNGSSTFTGPNNSAFNLDVDGEIDFADNALQITDEIGGVHFEFRRVDSSTYIRISNLDKAQELAAATGSEYAGLLALIDRQLAATWIEVDPALLNRAESQCGVDVSDFNLPAEDIEILFERYEDTPFASIKSTADDKVNGQDAMRFVLEIDRRKAQEYGQNLEELSITKKLEHCGLDQAEQDEKVKSGSSELRVWVNSGSKTIIRVAGESADDPNETFELNLDYRPVDIDKPRDTQLLSHTIQMLLTDVTQGTGKLVGDTLEGTGELVEGILEGVGGLLEGIFSGLGNRP